MSEKWTEEEIRILKDFCQNPDGLIEPLLPNRKWDAIWRKAWKMGLYLSWQHKIGGRSSGSKKPSKWTDENIQKLREYCENPIGEVESLFPDFKRNALLKKAKEMGLKLPRKRFKWADEDIQKLREYCENPVGDVESLFYGFKRNEIIQKANSLGLKVPRKNGKWTDKNIQKLREYCENPVGDVEAQFPGFKRNEILNKANSLGLKVPRKGRKWTVEDIQKLKEYCENPIGEVETLFPNFKRPNILHKANVLGLSAPRKRATRKPVAPEEVWSDDETTTIILNYKSLGPYGTAELLPNKTPQDCFKFAKAIGIEKCPELTTNNREE